MAKKTDDVAPAPEAPPAPAAPPKPTAVDLLRGLLAAGVLNPEWHRKVEAFLADQ